MNATFKALLLAAAITFVGPPLGTAIDAHSSVLNPPAFIHGSLVCALNVNRFLRKIGRHGTKAASSFSFLKYQHTSAPHAGDVVFNSRGKRQGHVQIYDGNGKCWNPSSRKQRWVYQACNASWHNRHKVFLRVK